MALIDIYNIDNWTASEPAPWYIKLLPVATTIIGFLLGLLPGLIARQKFKRRTGKLFKLELESLKIALEEQLTEIKRYRNDFLNPPNPPSGLMCLTLVLFHKFEIIKTFDKVTLIKYFEKQEKEFATHYVSTFYQMFGVLERDTERLDKVYTEYQMEFDKISDSYLNEINYLRLLAIIERDKLGGDFSKDPVLVKLWEVAFSKPDNFTTDVIMIFAKDLHQKLLHEKVFMDTKHPLYKPILDLALKGSKIVSDYESKKSKYIGLLNMTEETFQSAFDDLNVDHKT
ncbi:MAG: hypothetical protein ABI315_03430 [Bacteroidia bacterium]